MNKEPRSQSNCDTNRTSPACHDRKRSSNSISNSSNSSGKTQNHSINNSQKRRRVSYENDDDILKLDLIENCLSSYTKSEINSQTTSSSSHSNNYRNFSNRNRKDNNIRNNNNNHNRINNNDKWHYKSFKYNNGYTKNNNNRPFIPYDQHINELQERLHQKDLQLKELKIDVMNRESDITELKIQHERKLLDVEKEHCRKIKEMQFQEIDSIQHQKDKEMKLRLALENKKEIIAKLRKELETAQNDILVTRAILETTNNRNVELTLKIAELLGTKKKNMSNKRLQTDKIELSPIKFHMSPPQSTIVHSTTKYDQLMDTHSKKTEVYLLNDRFIRNDSSDSGVSMAKSESLQSQISSDYSHKYDNDLSNDTKFLFSPTQKDKQKDLLKLFYKKSPKNPANQDITINIDGAKSEDYEIIDYIESPDEMPVKNLMEIRYDKKEQTPDRLNSLRVISKLLTDKYSCSREELQQDDVKFGEILEGSDHMINISGKRKSLDLELSNINSTVIASQKEELDSSNDLIDMKDKSEEADAKSQEFVSRNQQNTDKSDQNIKFCHEVTTDKSMNLSKFESLPSSLTESSKSLLKKLDMIKDDIESENYQDGGGSVVLSKDIFKSPSKTCELSPKIHNITQNSQYKRQSSSDLSKDHSGSSDNLSISSELQDFLNLSESDQVDEHQSIVPISESDFHEFAHKFKEKYEKNKIQKAARELLHIQIVPVYTNDIEKTHESATDSTESVNNVFADKHLLINQRNNDSTNVLKTTIGTDIKSDKNDLTHHDDANLLRKYDSPENNANVSENDADYDEYHSLVVPSIKKRESIIGNSDETSSISSRCTTSAEDTLLKHENNLTDKILADNDLRADERVNFICGAANVNVETLILEKSTEGDENSNKYSSNTVKAELQDLEETIKVLQEGSETMITRQKVPVESENKFAESWKLSECSSKFEEPLLSFPSKSLNDNQTPCLKPQNTSMAQQNTSAYIKHEDYALNTLKNPKKTRKIEDNCPSYLHSFQDFLTKSCIVTNPAGNKREGFQKDSHQKRRSLKIMKRRESILVDNHRVRRPKTEVQSTVLNIEVSKAVESETQELETEKAPKASTEKALLASKTKQLDIERDHVNPLLPNFSAIETDSQKSNNMIIKTQNDKARSHLGISDFGSELIGTAQEEINAVPSDHQAVRLKNQEIIGNSQDNVQKLKVCEGSNNTLDSTIPNENVSMDIINLHDSKNALIESANECSNSAISCSPLVKSISPEYKRLSSTSGNDSKLSPVESFVKEQSIPSTMSGHKKSPLKVNQKKSRNLPKMDEMGVCSQIVATALKNSQQQREMSRSSEERMLPSRNFDGYSRNEQFYGYQNERVESGFNTGENDKFDTQNSRNLEHDSENKPNILPNDKTFLDGSAGLTSQDGQSKSPSYLRSISYQDSQCKLHSSASSTNQFEPSFMNENPNIKQFDNVVLPHSTSSPFLFIDENNFKRAQNKNEISQLVITELTVFYELRKFESDNPKELFKSMARAITYYFYEKNPNIVPAKNTIKNYIMEVFYNYGTIKSEKDFLLSEDYGDDFNGD